MKVLRPNGELFQTVTATTTSEGLLRWDFANNRNPLEKNFLLHVQTNDGAGKTFTNAELNCYF